MQQSARHPPGGSQAPFLASSDRLVCWDCGQAAAGRVPHLHCSMHRALWRLWSDTGGTDNYFPALSLNVCAPGTLSSDLLHNPLENKAAQRAPPNCPRSGSRGEQANADRRCVPKITWCKSDLSFCSGANYLSQLSGLWGSKINKLEIN